MHIYVYVVRARNNNVVVIAGHLVPERTRRHDQAALPLRRRSAAAVLDHLVLRGVHNPSVRGERRLGLERAVHPGHLVRRVLG